MLFYCVGTDRLVNISNNLCEHNSLCNSPDKSCLVVMMKSGSLEKQVKEIRQVGPLSSH